VADEESEVVVWFNPSCSKCRGAVELLDSREADYSLVEYLRAPPDRATLERLVDQLVDPVADLVRTDDPAFKELGLDPADYREADAVVELLLAHPALLQRPVEVREGRAVIARPPERLAELLD